MFDASDLSMGRSRLSCQLAFAGQCSQTNIKSISVRIVGEGGGSEAERMICPRCSKRLRFHGYLAAGPEMFRVFVCSCPGPMVMDYEPPERRLAQMLPARDGMGWPRDERDEQPRLFPMRPLPASSSRTGRRHKPKYG